MKKRILFSILLLIIGLGLAEVSLRLIGWLLPNGKNAFVALTSRTLIVTLGESTTDAIGSMGDDAWPTILQQRLRPDFVIDNRGRVGTTTPALVSSFLRDYENQNVDLVIAMMGTNDIPQFWLKDSGLISGEGFFANLRLAKLTRLFLSRVIPAKPAAPPARERLSANRSKLNFPNWDSLIAKLRAREPAPELDQFVAGLNDLQAAQLYGMVAGVLRPPWGTRSRDFYLAYEYSMKGVERSMDVAHSGEIFLLESIILERPEKCDWFAERLLKEDLAPNDVELARLATCRPNSKTVQALFERYGHEFRVNLTGETPTASSYRSLYDFLHRRGVCLIAMQYPRLPAAALRTYFGSGEANDIFFVENLENFEKALETKNFNDLFYDKFGQIFGHATQLGNTLIAENVEKTVRHVMSLPQCQRRKPDQNK